MDTKINCNNGEHGALLFKGRNQWMCLLCNSEIDISKVRKYRKEISMYKPAVIEKGLGDYVVVEADNKEDKSSISIVRDKPKFSRGKVVVCGVDDLKQGDEIIFYTKAADLLGLGFPDNMYVVLMENVVALCGREESNE